jgi:glycosyltransferase involved in cell wall biosynthesis
MQQLADSETAEMRKDIVTQSEVFSDRVTDFPLVQSDEIRKFFKNKNILTVFSDDNEYLKLKVWGIGGNADNFIKAYCEKKTCFYFNGKVSDLPEDFQIIPEAGVLGESYSALYSYRDFIEKNSGIIDIFVISGVSVFVSELILLYKKLRPDGIIYWEQELSSSGYNYLAENPCSKGGDIKNTLFLPMEQCSLVSGSESSFTQFLNANMFSLKPCYTIAPSVMRPIGKLDFKRENTIIVSHDNAKIGSVESNIESLLNVFSYMSPVLPDWKLKFIGETDERIKPLVETYIKKVPLLKETMIFTDRNYSDAEIYSEMAKAKIFCVTSDRDFPYKSYAKALYFGNFIIIPDSAEQNREKTLNGKIGKIYKSGDGQDLTNMIIEGIKATRVSIPQELLKNSRSFFEKRYDRARTAKRIVYHLCF